MGINWFKYASPASFYPLAGRMIPWFVGAAIVLGAVGLYVSFFVAPTDYKQGEGYRIIFVHVPASWMSMWIYFVMACWAMVGFVFRTRLSHMMAKSLAPTGALMAFLALWTGAFWGKPMWGTYWVWDARITSELVLLFLYLGYIALESSIEDADRAARASGLLAIVGVINLPIIYFSVVWWNTLHQGASIKIDKAEATMATSMLIGMLIMTLAFWAYSVAVSLVRVRSEILEREQNAEWVAEMFAREGEHNG